MCEKAKLQLWDFLWMKLLYGNKTGSLCEWRNADTVLLARATVHRNSASTSDGGT